jgi:hypothetical protein
MNRLSIAYSNWKLKTFRNLSRFNNELEGEIPSSLYQVGVKTLLSNKLHGRLKVLTFQMKSILREPYV